MHELAAHVTAHASKEPALLEYTGLELSSVLEWNPKPLPILDVHLPGRASQWVAYMYMHVHIYLPEVHYSQLTFSPQLSISVVHKNSIAPNREASHLYVYMYAAEQRSVWMWDMPTCVCAQCMHVVCLAMILHTQSHETTPQAYPNAYSGLYKTWRMDSPYITHMHNWSAV